MLELSALTLNGLLCMANKIGLDGVSETTAAEIPNPLSNVILTTFGLLRVLICGPESTMPDLEPRVSSISLKNRC